MPTFFDYQLIAWKFVDQTEITWRLCRVSRPSQCIFISLCFNTNDDVYEGSGISELSKSALISWILEKGTQFVIDSNAALLVFKTFQKKLDQDCAGFSISYEAIGTNKIFVTQLLVICKSFYNLFTVDNRTTPVPTTTDYPRTTPLPLNPDLLLTPIVWLNYTVSNRY